MSLSCFGMLGSCGSCQCHYPATRRQATRFVNGRSEYKQCRDRGDSCDHGNRRCRVCFANGIQCGGNDCGYTENDQDRSDDINDDEPASGSSGSILCVKKVHGKSNTGLRRTPWCLRVATLLAERYSRDIAFLFRLDLQKTGGCKTEHAGNDAVGKTL